MSILVDENSRIIIQGITGRDATTMSKEMMEYGANVVGGVTPGKEGLKVHGIPVYDCVKDAVASSSANASVVSVPPAFAKDAILESVENGIKVMLVLTERIPRQDVIEAIEFANSHGVYMIGPNSGGIISPGKTRLGYLGGNEIHRTFFQGPVGIMSRSGGMTTEIANLLTVEGLGQSTAVSIGGDPIIGMTYVDYLKLFEKDPETQGIVLYGEPGGMKEEAAAEFIKGGEFSKPVVAFFGGKFVDDMPGKRFGHASVIVQGDSGSIKKKTRALKEGGVAVVETYSEIAPMMNKLLTR